MDRRRVSFRPRHGVTAAAAAGLVVAVVAAGAVFLGAPAVYFLTDYGCGDAEDRLAGTLAGEAVLAAEPAGAGREETYRECDDDDLFVVVGARYRAGSAARQDVLAHYRRAAVADGWRPGPVSGCFTKAVGGTTAYLELETPDADGRFHVEIVADRAGSEWC
ncbi:hypothetical protein ACIBBD_08290 [Streptomyces sp. NPDC051315]|uniref:hypothetical protein n=1 Tax=Streptomyces sp. NPDC051315 TaxID=3365650 RepID=UPI0037A3C62D